MRTKRVAYIAVFTALITVGGLVSVPVPFTQIELSFQTVFVVTAGVLLGGADGALSVLVYVFMGLIGLPVFTRGGGLGYVLMPSFGYLVGFPLSALVAGSLVNRCKKLTRGKIFLSSLVAMLPAYIIGATYQALILYYYTRVGWAAAVGGLPAVAALFVKDGVLCGLASVVCPTVRRAIGKRSGAARPCDGALADAHADRANNR